MITRIEALNYRCLRHVAQDLGPFHILVGPNASGKSTFLDVPALMRDLVRDGRQDIGDVISSRAPNYEDLVWNRKGLRFEVAIELAIPDALRDAIGNLLGDLGVVPPAAVCRYELAIGSPGEAQELGILHEALRVREREGSEAVDGGPAGTGPEPPSTIMTSEESEDWETILDRDQDGVTILRPETGGPAGLRRAWKLNGRISALANVPYDEAQWPIATWVIQFLLNSVRSVALNSPAMRPPSSPNARRTFVSDGSSLPWLLEDLLSKNPNGLADQWLEHVRIALPNLRSVRVVSDPEGKDRYIKVRYDDGLEVPSWLVSDGTLRFLVLTLLAYMPEFTGTYLIEEPENGIHPTAVELVYDSMSSVYDGQVLVATHSPALLSLPKLDQVLCFSYMPNEGTRITRGNLHPALRHWKGEVSLGDLFAGGVLG